ncbi:ribosomal RNA small subunit methyltransferase A [Candidatus Bipolaricaulota bacterium]|nr:ribosomal RNA small subunit methyltransferase A [Candidatus Bipolaricaulota bacterium]
MLALYGVRPSKRLGQSFLADPATLDAIGKEVLQDRPSCVLEIGPGLGTVTELLAECADRVVAVEIDHRLAAGLGESFADRAHVEILDRDILDVDPRGWAAESSSQGLFVVGNIPYRITGPILGWFLKHRASFRSGVFLTQREVARKVAASPGHGGSILGVLLQRAGRVRPIRDVSRGAFYPIPEVDSTLWRIDLDHPPISDRTFESFERVVRAAYGMRRKTLRTALKTIYGESTQAFLESVGIDPGRRGETLTLEELDRIAASLDFRG